MRVRIVHTDTDVWTQGLSAHVGFEMRLNIARVDEPRGSHDLIRFIVDYVTEQGASITPEQTMEYGVWVIKFRGPSGGYLDVWERTAAGDDYEPGASTAIRYWTEQHRLCVAYSAGFSPPHLTQLAVISPGVREGDDVGAVRYASPDHMSGWWISTDRYDGDVHSMSVEHVNHVVLWRPDLIPYLALPPGWRFRTNAPPDVWFDPEAANALTAVLPQGIGEQRTRSAG